MGTTEITRSHKTRRSECGILGVSTRDTRYDLRRELGVSEKAQSNGVEPVRRKTQVEPGRLDDGGGAIEGEADPIDFLSALRTLALQLSRRVTHRRNGLLL